MRCKYIKKLISLMLDNELDDKRKKLLKEHLSSCKECGKEYEFFKDIQQRAAKEEIPDMQPRFREDIWNKIDEYEERSRRTFRKLVLVPIYTLAVILILILGTSSRLVYAYRSNIPGRSTDKTLIANYIKNCIMKINFSPMACLDFMLDNKACIHDACCESGECMYCKEKK